jgi:hypothetical protein
MSEVCLYGVKDRNDNLWICDSGMTYRERESAEDWVRWADEYKADDGPFTVVTFRPDLPVGDHNELRTTPLPREIHWRPTIAPSNLPCPHCDKGKQGWMECYTCNGTGRI